MFKILTVKDLQASMSLFGINVNQELIGEPVAKIPMVLDSNFEIKKDAITDMDKLLEEFNNANYNSLAILKTNFQTLGGPFLTN